MARMLNMTKKLRFKTHRIRVKLHWLILLSPVMLLPVLLPTRNSWGEALWDSVRLTLVCQVFAVLPHELGHLAGAWSAGIRRGTLIFGGFFGAFCPDGEEVLSRLTPGQRIVVFGLGPACNLLVASSCFALFYVLPIHFRGYVFGLRNYIIAFNLLLLVNLLPIVPLDGGRMLWDFLILFELRSKHIVCCLRVAALLFGGGMMVVLLRYGIWTDWLLWGLVLTMSAVILRGGSPAWNGLYG